VERQSREQKSVGNILSYLVYGLLAFFVIGAALAGYGVYTLSRQINEESVTVSDLDQRYAKANTDLATKLAQTQDSLNAAQGQITRQQDLIVKQQDAINRLITSVNDTTNAVKAEKLSRAQETAALRSRVRELESKEAAATTQKY
jgi:Flp pilus assembly protein TadB